tara:strand:- start:276 stop:626 length:351 start_codon:yes stop_codon:yes gene_type:complete
MKYLIANDQPTLTSMGAADQTLMFPQNRVLGMISNSDTALNLMVQSTADPDDEDAILFGHADKSAAATHKAERNLIDDIVAAINNDSKSGFTVLFDRLNNVKLDNQVLSTSTVTED